MKTPFGSLDGGCTLGARPHNVPKDSNNVLSANAHRTFFVSIETAATVDRSAPWTWWAPDICIKQEHTAVACLVATQNVTLPQISHHRTISVELMCFDGLAIQEDRDYVGAVPGFARRILAQHMVRIPSLVVKGDVGDETLVTQPMADVTSFTKVYLLLGAYRAAAFEFVAEWGCTDIAGRPQVHCKLLEEGLFHAYADALGHALVHHPALHVGVSIFVSIQP
jgi:hypothetical protein